VTMGPATEKARLRLGLYDDGMILMNIVCDVVGLRFLSDVVFLCCRRCSYSARMTAFKSALISTS